MDNNTVIPLEGDQLLTNQLELVVPTTVAGTLYGIAFTLFCLYIHLLSPQLRDGDRKRQARFMLGFSSIIILCGLYILIANTWAIQDAYIKHNNYPGGPYSYENSTLHTAITIALISCWLVVDTLTSAIQIWRVWVVWGATAYRKLVIVLPLLCFLTFTVLRLRVLILEVTIPIAELDQLDKTGQVGYAIQGVITVLCTLLISLYLIFRHWHQRKMIGKAQGFIGYICVVSILIESYALESIWLLITTITWKSSIGTFFEESALYIEIIAYFLVQYRVANGTAYKSQRTQQTISSLHWNHENVTTTRSGGVDEHSTSGPHVPSGVKRESSEALPVSSMA